MKRVNWKELNTIEDGCGGVIYKMLSTDSSGLQSVEVAMCIFAPCEVSMLHYHNQMEEIYYIIEGEGEIEVNNITHKVVAEDSISIPLQAKHRIKNISETNTLRFLSINAPSWIESDMIFV